MFSYVWSLVAGREEPARLPSPVSITGIRFPADGSKPHTLPLTTTTHGVMDGPDSFWGHVPDLRSFWKTEQAWRWRDIETFRLEHQPLAHCNGLYIVFYSYDDKLPMHSNFPHGVYGRERTFCGDTFVVKIQGTEIGEDLGDDGWAAWVDVPSDILDLPIMKS